MQLTKLDSLESDLTEEQYLKTESFLFEASFVVRDHFKRYQWKIAVSRNSEEHIVYLYVTPKNIKSTSCSCQKNQKEGCCLHVTSSLLFLRGYLLEKKAKKTISKPRTFNTKTILDTISDQQMRQFIASYASADSKFSTALKVHFARQIPSEDIESKYKGILQKILKPIAGKKFYTIPAINYFIKNASELLEQAKDTFALENYIETSVILHALLDKAMHAYTRTKVENEKLEHFINQLYDEITLFFKSSIAPKLRQSFCSKLLEIFAKSSYPLDFSPSIIQDIFIKLGTKSEIKLAIETINTKFELSRLDSERTVLFFLLLKTHDAINLSISKIGSRIRVQHLHGIFRLLLQAEDIELVKAVLKEIRDYEYLQEFKFEDIEIIIGRRHNDHQYLAEALSRKYVRTKEPSFLDELLSIPAAVTEKTLRSLYQLLLNKDRLGNQDLQILDKLQEYDLIISHIMEKKWYEEVPKYIPKIAAYSADLVRFFSQKYKDECLLDADSARRNQIYIMQGLRAIYDDKLASEQIEQMRAFHEQLEEMWLPEM